MKPWKGNQWTRWARRQPQADPGLLKVMRRDPQAEEAGEALDLIARTLTCLGVPAESMGWEWLLDEDAYLWGEATVQPGARHATILFRREPGARSLLQGVDVDTPEGSRNHYVYTSNELKSLKDWLGGS